MDDPRRPTWDPSVRLALPVTVQFERTEAFALLAALHEARGLLREGGSAELLGALTTLERELGVAIGVEPARRFLRQRARRAGGRG